ncbi:response regulator [Nocardioides rubriscoriae]|uniref:response regulator n=1 Tax=Nocardioides rubriscoriae TaxID=642762 RepID=UPI0011DF65F6|nr:response regulator transcription factor [Nocardioides rubriscoriae]
MTGRGRHDSTAPVRVVVVDDQDLVRDGLVSVLSQQDGIEVVGDAADGEQAITVVTRLAPDVVLMDARMPVLDGIAATARLKDVLPTSRVVILTTFDDADLVGDALAAGAVGYLLKDLPTQDLADAVRLAAAGVGQFSGAVTRSLTVHRPPRTPEIDLSPRELDVLRLIGTGATNRQIAARLHVSEGTVKNHVSRILVGLGLRDRTQAALWARDVGLL